MLSIAKHLILELTDSSILRRGGQNDISDKKIIPNS
jgi:hypothetical protein